MYSLMQKNENRFINKRVGVIFVYHSILVKNLKIVDYIWVADKLVKKLQRAYFFTDFLKFCI